MATGWTNRKSEQIAVRLPRDLAAEATKRAVDYRSKGKAIVAALRVAWDLPEPSNKQPDKAA